MRLKIILLVVLLTACGAEMPGQENMVTVSSSSMTTSSAMKRMGPLPNLADRKVLKPFGIFIERATSPVQPERFSGYHTGIDFEILPGEEGAQVPVSAICDGPVRMKKEVSGYGGVVVQECTLRDEVVTVLYGHMDLASVARNVEETIRTGERVGELGNPHEGETDGERKHLHLAVHRGKAIELRGYVQSKDALEAWVDPTTVLP